MPKLTTFDDLRPHEKIQPYCMRCDKTDEELDTDKISEQFGEGVPIELVKKYIVCKQCGKKDKVVLRIVTNKK